MISKEQERSRFALNQLDKIKITKELANVARALNGHGPTHDAEHCPHCGEVLRVRGRWCSSTAQIVNVNRTGFAGGSNS